MNTTQTTSLPELLLALRRKINERVREDDLKHELTASQLEVLWFIGTGGSRTMESIANHLGVKPPTVTPLIDKLEKGKYVIRGKSSTDRRVINISLTERMRKKVAALRKQKEAAFASLTAKLAQKDRKNLERILLLLIKN